MIEKFIIFAEEVYKMLCEHISGLVNWEIVRRIHNFFFEKTIGKK